MKSVSIVIGFSGMLIMFFGLLSAPGWAEAMFFGYLLYTIGKSLHEEEKQETTHIEKEVKP